MFIICLSVKNYGQDSLSYYLEEAAANNPGLKAKFLEYSAALEKVPQAASLPDPELQFGYFIKPMQQMNGNQVNDLRIMQMFPWFGTLKAAKDEASRMALARYEEMRNLKFQIYKDVKISWYKVYRTKNDIEITRKNLEILRSLERLALIKFKSGGASASGAGSMALPATGMQESQPGNTGMNTMGNSDMAGEVSGSGRSNTGMAGPGGGSMGSSQGGMVDILRVQMEIKTLENRIALLNDQLVTDKISFNRYLYRHPSADVYIEDSLMDTGLPFDFTVFNDSLDNNPMIRMFEYEKSANEAKLEMVTRMSYPMVGLGLNYSVYQKRDGVSDIMNGEDMIMPMLTLSLPIYRKKYNAMRREAGFLRDAAGESADNLRNDLAVNLQEWHQLYLDAGRRIKLNNELSSLAEKSVTLLTASYQSEGTDFEEILRLQQQWLDYQFRLIEAVVDKNSAVAAIESLIAYNL